MADVLGTCSCASLRQATRHVTRLYDIALAPVALGINQYSVLATLERGGPRVLQDLADTLVMDRSSLGHLLRPLEQRGLVAIRVADDDRRRRQIELTAQGQDVMRRAKPLWQQAEARFQAGFGIEAAGALRAVLTRVATMDLSA